MKKTLTSILIAGWFGATCAHAELVGYWNFDGYTTPVDLALETTLTPTSTTVAASLILKATANGTNLESVLGTTENATSGDTANEAINLRRITRWNGDTTNFTSGSGVAALTIAFDASGTSDTFALSFAGNHAEELGYDEFRIGYSSNYGEIGESWTAITSLTTMPLASWTTFATDNDVSFAGSANAAFRISFTPISGDAGTRKGTYLDNIQLITVPEPSSIMFIGLSLLAGISVLRRKQN